MVQRSKESAHDYRYFPEPDLPPLEISRDWAEELPARLPELPDAKADRFISEYGPGPPDARALADDRAVAEYFEAMIAARGGVGRRSPRTGSRGELFRLMNAAGVGIEAVKRRPDDFAALLGLVAAGRLNQNSAKRCRGDVRDGRRKPGELVQEMGLVQVSDADALADAVHRRWRSTPTRSHAIAGRGHAVGLADGSGDARNTRQGESGDAKRSADPGPGL